MKTFFNQKNRLAFLLAMLVTHYGTAQNILTADRNPGAVAVAGSVFVGATALQDAIAAAVDDDIIHVIRSSTSYGAIIVDKRLNIFGIGLFPDTDGSNRSYVTTVEIADPVASGTRISGMVISTSLTLGGIAGALNNLLIENSQILRIQHEGSTTTLNNIIIRNNLLGNGIGASTEETIDFLVGYVSNVVIANNVIYGSSALADCCNASQGTLTTDFSTIENNLFIHTDVVSGGWFAFEELRNSIVKNNIFYGIGPRGKLVLSNNTFENNLSFTSKPTQGFLTTGGNTSVNNITGQNPLFVNVSFGTGVPSLSTFDPTLDTGSPALGSGTSGTDMGVYGGPIPFNLEGTLIPTIQVLDVPSMVIEGNDLNVHIQAKGN
ncbi:MAG: hypothetical protein RIE59_23675 [Imperialibacter sp.]